MGYPSQPQGRLRPPGQTPGIIFCGDINFLLRAEPQSATFTTMSIDKKEITEL
jgi:hypothetical protein